MYGFKYVSQEKDSRVRKKKERKYYS